MTSQARRLRKIPTEAEKTLWKTLRRDQLGVSFRRQHPVGSYVLDFYCPSLRLAIEVDGGQHAEQTKQADDRRTRWLAEQGVIVVRYWNNDVLTNLSGVLSDVLAQTETLRQVATPSPTLPLAGGGRRDPIAPQAVTAPRTDEGAR